MEFGKTYLENSASLCIYITVIPHNVSADFLLMVTNKRDEGKISNCFYLWMTYSSLKFLDLTQQSMYKASLNLPEDDWLESSREKMQAETRSQNEDTERGFLLGQILLIFESSAKLTFGKSFLTAQLLNPVG